MRAGYFTLAREKPDAQRSPNKMKKRKVIRFVQWSALSLAVVSVATYAIDRATGFHVYFALQSFGSVQQVVPSPTGHATT